MDPAALYQPDPTEIKPQEAASLEELLDRQLLIATRIQDTLLDRLRPGMENSLMVDDLKDLVAAVNGLVNLSHKTEEALKKINTLQKFVGVVVEFLRARSDTLGTDLLAELSATAKELGQEGVVTKAVQ